MTYRMKRTLYSEAAYILGIVTLALGTALTEMTDLGLSMVVAPAYLLYVKIGQYVPQFTFGMAEYVLQALLLIVLAIIMKRFRIGYILSFITTILYGIVLDLFMRALAPLQPSGIAVRIVLYAFGMIWCALGVTLLIHTYFSPEAYELFVKEIAGKYSFHFDKAKTIYDCTSCLVAIVMSFAFFGFGRFVGVGFGTIASALLNGWMIGRMSRILESDFEIKDLLGLRKYYEK